MLTEDYRVRLESFEGPLDLLLFLIRKNEVDVTNIPIAPIADQYIAFLKDLDKDGTPVDIEVAGEFLVMAASLMEIKSRWLARSNDPNAPVASDDSGVDATDPRADLVRQLLAYKQYRDAADALEFRGKQWQARFPVGGADELAPTVDEQTIRDEVAALDVEDLELTDLLEAFKKIVATVNFERLGDHQVVYDDTPIELHAADIVDRIKNEPSVAADAAGSKPRISFRSLLTNRSRSEMIGLFLAVLDLVRRRVVGVAQDKQSSEITLELRDPDDAPVDGVAAASTAPE